MYQTVMILLVTAVITIITTIVTVRLTMTGRIVSQTARDRFRKSVRRYGVILGNLPNVLLNAFLLISFTRNPRPMDRADVVLASFMVCLLMFGLFGLLIGVAYVWLDRLRDRQVSD
jgi:ABC-type arginine transport system permease subunit